MSTVRTKLPERRVGYKVTIPQPMQDENGNDLTGAGPVTVKALDPSANKITPTATQRTTAGEEHIWDILITAAQMTTGGAGTWKVDVYYNSEAVFARGLIAGYTFAGVRKDSRACV